MAKWEVHWRLTVPEAIWWRWMPGEEFNLPWPSGEVTVTENEPGWDWTLGTVKQTVQSSDPNDHYRPWLEKNIGRQGWDWQWRHHFEVTMYTPGYEEEMKLSDRVVIKVRRSKAKMIPWAILALT